MAPRITTFGKLYRSRLARYPEKRDWVCIYIPNGANPIRRVIGPPGEESIRVAQAAIDQVQARDVGEAVGLAPLFSDSAEQYLDTGVKLGRLAGSTVRMTRYRVAAFVARWGHLRIDQVSTVELVDWWEDHIIRGGLDPETGRRWLSALSGVYRYAAQKGVPIANPVRAFLPTVTVATGTKAVRSELEDTANPIETAAELAALDRALHAEGDPDLYLLVLLMLDQGERRGEAFAARPRDMILGASDDDPARLVWVRKNRPGGGPAESPKSGRIRAVPMSRRLRAHLREHFALWPIDRPLAYRLGEAATKRARKKSEADGSETFERYTFPRLMKLAGLGDGRNPKDLRDTFASHLLTAGFPQLQIMRWLGHAPGSVAMFRRRYARWIGGEGESEWTYREPAKLRLGEVPSDLLASLARGDKRATR